ncbi:MAG: oligoribonuclease [Myxococcota bacterium]
MRPSSDTLVWVDLEMTGLDPASCHIVQLAMVLTDTELNDIAAPLDLVVWQPPAVLEEMSPFVRQMHEGSGLLEKIRTSTVGLEDAERQALELVSTHASYRKARLCGNSIGQDRRFLVRYMPVLEGYLHYRQIDVSTVKELAGWWYGKRYEKSDEGKHTALIDIRQSIAELKHYRTQIFR